MMEWQQLLETYGEYAIDTSVRLQGEIPTLLMNKKNLEALTLATFSTATFYTGVKAQNLQVQDYRDLLERYTENLKSPKSSGSWEKIRGLL